MTHAQSADPFVIPAIILAAGASTRLGEPKQLLRLKAFGGETLLERAVHLAEEAGAAPVYIVLGAHAEAIQRAVDLSRCTILLNPAWAEGMASSIRLGILAVIEQAPAAGALLMVCDQPALSAEHLRQLLASHRAQPEIISASRYAGHLGVPATVPRSMFPALLTLTGDHGARAILRKAGLPIDEIEFPGGAWDIDTPDRIEN